MHWSFAAGLSAKAFVSVIVLLLGLALATLGYEGAFVLTNCPPGVISCLSPSSFWDSFAELIGAAAMLIGGIGLIRTLLHFQK